MKLNTIIEGVSKIDISNEYKIIWEKDAIYLNDDKLTSENIFHFDRYGNSLLVHYNNGEIVYFFDLKSLNNKQIKTSGNFLSEDIILTGEWNNTFTEKFTSAIQIETNKALWKSSELFSVTLENKNHFFSYSSKKINKRELDSSKVIWEVTIENLLQKDDRLYKIKKFTGIFKNLLLIALEPNTIISLDISSGDLLNVFSIHDAFPEFADFQKDTFSTSYHLDELNNRLVILSYTTLYHINLITKEIKLVKDYHNVPQQEQWRFMSATFYKNKLYFTGDLGLEYVVATRVGVMDVETGEVLWQQQLKKTGGLPNAPQVTEDKLYVHTVNAQLYIFEKEKL